MQLHNSFVVPAPVDDAWRTLLDVERIAPCMPGASVDSVDGDRIDGRVTVKLGPVTVRYRGTVVFVERDEAAHRAVLEASAKDGSGGGTARATIAARLRPAPQDAQQTQVDVVTDLDVTGKPAQFGRGVMADVSKHVMNQFAANLSTQMQNTRTPTGVPAPARPAAAAVTPPHAEAAPAELDALALLREPLTRAAPPLLVGLVLGWAVSRLAGSGRRRNAGSPLVVLLREVGPRG